MEGQGDLSASRGACQRRPASRAIEPWDVVESVMIFGASWGELGFAALMVVIVVLVPIAPRIGEAIGACFEKEPPER